MHIAIIGGGFTGLTAAYELSAHGHRVSVFEKEPHLGGLAYGFRAPHWAWHLEGAYHHLFTNDSHIMDLMRRIGIRDALIVKRPITATLWNGKTYQLDSPYHLLVFPGLSIIDKCRTALLLAFLKTFPFWQLLEHITAEQLLTSIGGKQAWNIIWEPLLYGKFGTYAPSVSAAWFWARIVKRTPSLCYVEGGFTTIVRALEQAIRANGGTIYTQTPVTRMTPARNGRVHVAWGRTTQAFDRVLLTVPTPFALSLIPLLADDPRWSGLHTIPHLFAQTLILETDAPLLNRVYWLNVTDRKAPFLAAVAHTNFMDPARYGGRHLTYFGNYLPQGHRYLTMTKEQLLEEFLPYIRKLCPSVQKLRKTMDSYMFVGPFAQPVHQQRYSRRIPPIPTPIPHVYMANMDYVVPWDRGTNYAVELGKQAAECILRETK